MHAIKTCLPGDRQLCGPDRWAAMDMVADRVLDARRKGWQDTDEHGRTL
jgi:hypothetical protein